MDNKTAPQQALFLRLSRIYESAGKSIMDALNPLKNDILSLPKDMDKARLHKEINKLLKKHHAVRIMAGALADAGVSASAAVLAAMPGVWTESAQSASDALIKEAKTDLGLSYVGALFLSAAMKSHESREEKLSHRRLSSKRTAEERVKKALKKAAQRTTDKADFLPLALSLAISSARMHAVTLTRTQQTHFKGNAAYVIGKAASKLGLRIYKKWHCQMRINSRDPHKERDGLCAMIDDPFPGSVMQYPGDPAGGAGEVCNCICTMTLHILPPGARIIDGRVIKGG